MRCYKVSLVGADGLLATRYAGTQADARHLRNTLATRFGVKPSAVAIDEAEVPYDKAGAFAFINGLCAKLDQAV